MKKNISRFLCLFVVFTTALLSCENTEKPITIEELVYKNTEHFKIVTEKATYYLEKKGGGFSSIIDNKGTDWVQFHKSDTMVGASGAAADFRGLPNMVFQGEQNGVGHPGFDQCISQKVNDTLISVTSQSGNYAFTFAFTHDHVVMHIEKANPSRKYWMLYEGPIAGKFSPQTHICVTNKGYHPEKPSIFDETPIMGHFEWMCFGDENYDYMFYVEHVTPDTLIDMVCYMGSSGAELGNNSPDGMVVMGFGRDANTNPQMGQFPNTFKFGFIDKPQVSKTNMQAAIAKKLQESNR